MPVGFRIVHDNPSWLCSSARWLLCFNDAGREIARATVSLQKLEKGRSPFRLPHSDLRVRGRGLLPATDRYVRAPCAPCGGALVTFSVFSARYCLEDVVTLYYTIQYAIQLYTIQPNTI